MISEYTKNARNIGLLAVITAALVLIGTYAFVTLKTQQHYEHIRTVQEELLVQIQLERRVRDMSGVLAELSQERVLVQKYFKTPDDVIAIIEELEGFGAVVGAPVSVVQVQVEGEDAVTREGVFVVSVFSEGEWSAIAHLLSLLDALPYQSTVSELTLDTSGVDEDTPRPQWSLRATLRITLKR